MIPPRKIFFITANFNFFVIVIRMKNKNRYINANNASEVCVIMAAPKNNPRNTHDFSKSIFEVYQNTPIRKSCETIAGQCPHVKPLYKPPEKTKNENGSDIIATFLLKCLITKYISNDAAAAIKKTRR